MLQMTVCGGGLRSGPFTSLTGKRQWCVASLGEIKQAKVEFSREQQPSYMHNVVTAPQVNKIALGDCYQ